MDAQTSLFSLSTTFTGPRAAESTLINALARFEEKNAIARAALDAMKPDAPDFSARSEAHKLARDEVQAEAFRVVGAVEAALMQLKTR